MKRVYINIMGSLDQSVIDCVTASLVELLIRDVKVIHNPAVPDYALDPCRDQYYARAIVERLLHELPLD